VDINTWAIVAEEEHTWTRPYTEFADGRFQRV